VWQAQWKGMQQPHLEVADNKAFWFEFKAIRYSSHSTSPEAGPIKQSLKANH